MTYTCSDCGRQFSRKDHLSRHATRHNNHLERCSICLKTFTRKDALRRHRLTRHPAETASPAARAKASSDSNGGISSNVSDLPDVSNYASSLDAMSLMESFGVPNALQFVNNFDVPLSQGSLQMDDTALFQYLDGLQAHTEMDPSRGDIRGLDQIVADALDHAQTTSPWNNDKISLPSNASLDHLVSIYFDKFHYLLPILHRSSFSLHTVHPSLVLMVASIGTKYSQVPAATGLSLRLGELARRCLVHAMETDIETLKNIDCLQAALLIIWSGVFSGDKKVLNLTQTTRAIVMMAIRDDEAFEVSPVDAEATLSEKWKQWSTLEAKRRIRIAALLFDGVWVRFFDFLPSLKLTDALRYHMLCHEALWTATSAEEWSSILLEQKCPAHSPMTVFDVLQQTLAQIDQLSFRADDWGFRVLMAILSCMSRQDEVVLHQNSLLLGNLQPAPTSLTSMVFTKSWTIFETWLNTSLVASSSGSKEEKASLTMIAATLHFYHMTINVPLRLLQSAASRSMTGPQSITKPWQELKLYFGGRLGREAVWHAGQIYGHILLNPGESPLETVALFYAALVLWAYCTLETSEPASMIESMPLYLDMLQNSQEMAVVDWFEGRRSAELRNIGRVCRTNRNPITLALADGLTQRTAWGLSQPLTYALRQLLAVPSPFPL